MFLYSIKLNFDFVFKDVDFDNKIELLTRDKRDVLFYLNSN